MISIKAVSELQCKLDYSVKTQQLNSNWVLGIVEGREGFWMRKWKFGKSGYSKYQPVLPNEPQNKNCHQTNLWNILSIKQKEHNNTILFFLNSLLLCLFILFSFFFSFPKPHMTTWPLPFFLFPHPIPNPNPHHSTKIRTENTQIQSPKSTNSNKYPHLLETHWPGNKNFHQPIQYWW